MKQNIGEYYEKHSFGTKIKGRVQKTTKLRKVNISIYKYILIGYVCLLYIPLILKLRVKRGTKRMKIKLCTHSFGF